MSPAGMRKRYAKNVKKLEYPMLASRISTHLTKPAGLVLVTLAVAWLTGHAYAADPNQPAPPTSQVFRFTKVTPAEAAVWLKKLNLGETVSELKEANALVVTCAYSDLPKVRTMLKYLDTLPDVTVKVLTPLPAPANWPSNKMLQERLKDMGIGTFRDPPLIAPGGVVIDEHSGFLVAVGNRDDLQKVLEVVAKLQSGRMPAPEPVKPTVKKVTAAAVEPSAAPVESSDDKLLERMIDSLSKQEKAAASAKTGLSTPPVASTEANAAPSQAGQMSQDKFTEMVRGMVKEETEKQMSQGAAAGKAEEARPAAEADQPTAADFNIPAGDLELELQLPERLEVIDLLDLLGKYLKINYMFDETVLKGQAVSLRVQGKIKVKELYAIAENVLRFRGLSMTRSNDLVTISQINTSSPSNGTFVTGVEGVRPGDVVVTRIFQLHYANTSAVRALLTSLKFANNGQNISEITETGTLVVTDYSLAMPKIEELLSVVDKPGDDRTFRFVKLKYTMAKNLAPKLKDLAEQLGTVSISVSASAASAVTPGVPNMPRPVVARPMPTGGGQGRPGVYLDYDERTNRLLIVGRKEEISLVEKLIVDLDVAQQDLRTLKQYTIQHVDTSEVLATLKEQGIIQETPQASTRTTTTYSRTTRPGMPNTPIPGQEGGQPQVATMTTTGTGPVVEPPMISVIESTNSLLINATAEQHAAIGQIIAYVDQERGESNINYVVYPLENQDPEKLKSILESLITGKTVGTTDKEKKIQRSTATTRTPYQPGGMNAQPQPPQGAATPSAPTAEAQEQEITIVADPSTYSLIVYASKKNQQWISNVIKELDTYRPQVLLDCTLVAVNRDDAFKTDLQMITRFGSNLNTPTNNLQGLTAPAALPKPFPDTGWIGEASNVSGTGSVFYADQHIQAIFTAMQQKRYGRVMSRPQILVNDNEEGTIKSEDKKYVAQLKTTYISTSGGSGGNIISQPVQDVTYQDYPAGVTLTITPHISKGENLRLQIELDRTDYVPGTGGTDVVGGVQYTKPQDTTSNNVTSVVTVPDNSTIILGGLESLTQTKGGTKVPVLGDLPLVGGLFRSENNTDQQTKLYIFVKAHILRPGEDGGKTAVERVSQPKIEGFEKMERDMQRYQDWPGLDAQPMQPKQVLEER